MNKVELLSPAGDYNCFLAAINAGADAVYLSGEKYGARAYAKNFSTEELISAINYAHVFNSKVFLTVNTLIKDDEMLELYEYLLPFYEAGLDGVIVQDMGVISCIRRWFNDLPVHASTQLAITGLEGINFLEKQGVCRTVLAREVTLDEIKYIHSKNNMELECFVHGALCYSYSGKCLFSSLVGGRSGNRGRCAGSCRQPYNDKYVLSTKDICCLSIIPDLIDAGICSFKIEGRMKSPEYVSAVTSVYRKYIDLYYSYCDKLSLSEIKNKYFAGNEFNNDLDLLLRLYTRGGKSEGYYYKHNGKEMISLSDASYKSDNGKAKAYVNDNIISNYRKLKVDAFISIHPNESISLQVYNDEMSVSCTGSMAMLASNRPVDEEMVSKQLKKTKDTEFEFENIYYYISPNAFVRVSDINELRRHALNLLKENIVAKYKRSSNKSVEDYETIVNISYNDIIDGHAKNYDVNCRPELVCDICTMDQFFAVCDIKGIKRLYIPFNLLKENERIIFDNSKKNNKEIYVKFQSVIRYNFLEKNKDYIISVLNKADGVVADSHEVIEFVNNLDDGEVPIIGDIHIYVLNRESKHKYNSSIDKTTVPVELSKKELYRRNIYNEELVVYGYLPMMISAQCVNKTLSGCDKTYKDIKLTDRTGATFTAVNNCSECSNIIYNSVPLSLHTEGDFIKKIRPSSVRVMLTIEDKKRSSEIVEYYSEYIDCLYDDDMASIKARTSSIFKENTYTKGHLGRGVL